MQTPLEEDKEGLGIEGQEKDKIGGEGQEKEAIGSDLTIGREEEHVYASII